MTLDLLLKIGALASFVSLIFGTLFIAFKKNQSLDRGNQAWLILHGDKDSKVPAERTGLLDLFEDHLRDNDSARDHHPKLRELITEAASRARGIQEGFAAYGSKPDQIAQGVRKSLEEMARASDAARANRQGIVRDQEGRFDRGSDPGPSPFDPEGTGRFKGRKR